MENKLFEKEMPGAKSVSGVGGNSDESIDYLCGLRRPLRYACGRK